MRFSFPAIVAVLPLATTAQQWQPVTTIPAPYATNYWLDVFFLPSNPQYGWICGFNGMVIRTTDGGRTWQGTQIPGAYQLESIHFVTPTIGYTSGPDGIWRSTDGGITWTEVTPDSAFALWGCYFLSSAVGMVIGGGCGSAPQHFFRTTNGGITWSLFTGNEPNSGLTDLLLLPDGTGFAVSSGRLWYTSDSGQTWTVFATTGSNIWQEELTKIGNSFLLPFAGTSCSGQGNTGGMRFSTDGGTTWREFITGKPMFGAFLLTPTTGWACGYNGALYYTSDGGQTWQLRNCGIDTTRHLDDIWFVNDTLGWVVGQGVWRYGPPERRFDRDSLAFPEVCLPGSADKTLRLENRSFSQSSVSLTFTGPDASAFRLVSFPSNAILASCSWTSITLRFEPTRPGLHQAQLVATFSDGMVRRVELIGIGRTRDGFPEKDTLLIPAAPCGIRTRAHLRWRSNDSAAIVRIDWIGGYGGIQYESLIPLPIPRSGTELTFSVLPTDTGWLEARFRIRLYPCAYDTVIVVRAYGVSPILTAPNSRTYTLRCQLARLDSLPIVNTGNDTLVISRFWLDQSPPGSVTVLGWTSQRDFPLSIPPHYADTLLLLLQPPTEGTFVATLWLENNDSTKARGQKNPFRIELSGEARRSLITAELSTYDFGRTCLGTTREFRLRLRNQGTLTAFLSQPRVSPPFAAELEDRRNPPLVLGGDSVGLRIRFSPAWEGLFTDTVIITATPCGERIAIALRGEGIQALLQATPTQLKASVPSSEEDTLLVALRASGSAHVRIERYRWDPPAPPWIRILEPTPGTWLQSGERIPLRLAALPVPGQEEYTGTLCIEADAECPTSLCVLIELRRGQSITKEYHWSSFCTPIDTVVTLYTIANPDAVRPDTIQYILDPPTPTFQVTSPPFSPYSLQPGGLIPLRLRVHKTTEGQEEARLQVVFSHGETTLLLTLRAELYRSQVELLAAPSIDFGTVEPCEERTIALPLVNRGSLADTVSVELLPASSAFRLQSPAQFILPGGSTDTVRILLVSSLLAEGQNSAILRLRSLFCPHEQQVQLSATGLHPRLQAQPSIVEAGTVPFGESFTQELSVTNPSSIDLLIDSIWIEPAIPGLSIESPPLPTLLPAGQQMTLPLRFTASDSGTFQASLRIAARSTTCLYTAAVLFTAYVPPELYTLRLWMDHHVVRPGDTVWMPIWLQGATQRALVERISGELHFDPALLLPLELHSKAGVTSFSVGRNGSLSFSLPIPPQPDTVSAQAIAVLTGLVLAAFPSETPLHFAQAEVFAQKRTILNVTDGRLSVLFCGPNIRQLRLHEQAWATAIVTDEGIRVGLESSLPQPWTVSLSTADGRLCWRWQGKVEGNREILIPAASLATGFMLYPFTQCWRGNRSAW